MPRLEIIEVVLIQCNIFNNDFQQDTRYLYTFVPNKSNHQKMLYYEKRSTQSFHILKYGLLIKILNSKPLKIEDKINITLVNHQNVKYKK